MTPDPYVDPPSEPARTPRLLGLRPWLVTAVVVLLGAAWPVTTLVEARQDPTLEIPEDVDLDELDPDAVDPDALDPDDLDPVDIPTADPVD